MSKENKDDLIAALAFEERREGSAQDALDEAAARGLGINRTDLRCLDILEREGRMTAGRLAELTALSPGAVTAVLDRLEEAGLAQRVRDEEDRRRVYAEVTPKMRHLAQTYYGPIAETFQERMKGYTARELELILDYVRWARELQEEAAERIRGAF
jgi:DNA-binding MarR family transcriptional regulator